MERDGEKGVLTVVTGWQAQTGSTGIKARAFVEALAMTANVTRSCLLADVSKERVYAWRRMDEAFAAAWAEAMKLGIDALEDEAMRRATEGVKKYVVSMGKIVTDPKTGEPLVEHVYSDGLMTTLLKANKPDKYRERTETKHVGPDGGAVQVQALRDTLQEQMAERLAKLAIKS